MGIKDWFGRGPKDYNEQLIREAEAQHKAQPAKPVQTGWSGGDSGPAPAAPSEPSAALATQVVALVQAGKKIEAIKIYREATDLGLKESMDAVEALVAGGKVAPATPVAPPGTDAEVATLIAQNQKIAAIKLYREIHQVGLKEAKDAVDAMARPS